MHVGALILDVDELDVRVDDVEKLLLLLALDVVLDQELLDELETRDELELLVDEAMLDELDTRDELRLLVDGAILDELETCDELELLDGEALDVEETP